MVNNIHKINELIQVYIIVVIVITVKQLKLKLKLKLKLIIIIIMGQALSIVGIVGIVYLPIFGSAQSWYCFNVHTGGAVLPATKIK